MKQLRLFVSTVPAKMPLGKLVLAAIAVSVIGLGIAWIDQAQAQLSSAQIAGLQQRRQRELARVGLYLAYYDQVNRMAVAQGQLSPADADARLRTKATDLYHRSFNQADLEQLVGQNRQAGGAYFARVQQEVNASTRWQGNISPESAREAARILLEKGRRQYETALAARHDPLAGLMTATVIRGLAMGSQTPPPSIDVFANQWERITSSMPSPGTREVMSQMVTATRNASGIAQPATGVRPIPGEMGRPTPPASTSGIDSIFIPTPPPAGGIASIPGAATTMPPPGTNEIARGNALFQQSQYREALAAFDNALRGYPQSVEALLGRGLSLNALGDVAGARRAYETALQLNPGQPNLRTWLAEVAMAGNDYQRAEAALADELRVAPSSAWAYSFLGTLRMLQGRDSEARQAMATAMQMGSVVASHRYQNASFLSGVGQSQRALVEFSSVLLLDPNIASAHYGAGLESARLGQTARAIQEYETYLQYDGASQWAQLARQELARLRGQGLPNPSGLPPGATLSCPPDSIATAAGCVSIRMR